MILKFKVYEQTISLQSTKSEPRQGSKDYLELQFSFSSDWNDLSKYVYLQHGEVSVPHDLVEESIIVDEYFTEQTEFNVTLLGKSADGSVEVPTNVVTIFLKESNNLWVKDAPEPQNSWLVQVVDARDKALAAAIRAENAAIHQPYPNAETGTWWVWNSDSGVYTDTGVSSGDSITIDSELSDTSENPVQNKVIKSALDAKLAKSGIASKTPDMTQSVGVDEAGALWTVPVSGGGSGLPTGGAPYQQLVTDGTGTAKWEDRLAYEDVTNTVILEEQNLTFSKQGSLMGAIISKSLDVTVGEIAAVSWDGVLYNCTAEDFGGRVVLGNLGLFPGNSDVDTGEPFIIMSDGSSTQVGTSDTSTEHVLSISRKNMVMKKIEPKYLGLFVFPIYSDDKNGVSTSVSYDDVRAAFDAKIPIFAQKIYTISGLYVDQYEFCKAISHADDRLEFRFDSKIVKYLNDGTITEEVEAS